MRALVSLVCCAALAGGASLAACGGSTSALAPGDGGATDSAAPTEGGTTPDGAADAPGATDADAGPPVDAGPPCAPPADPTKSSLCVGVVPEAITFTTDPRFDGKGILVAEVFDTNTPDLAEGGSVQPLAAISLPGDGGTIDLSQPIAPIRFDGLPTAVYARVVFSDDPQANAQVGAGFWIGGYDLSGGIKTQMPLQPETLQAGSGLSVNISLIALREMTVTLDRTATPIGNAMGPATVVAVTGQTLTTGEALFGIGQNPCARVDGNRTAEVAGFVLGTGPYFIAPVLDDFGTSTSGIAFPAGALTSLDFVDGGYLLPLANQITYAADAYRVSQTVTLNVAIPGDAGVDNVTCP